MVKAFDPFALDPDQQDNTDEDSSFSCRIGHREDNLPSQHPLDFHPEQQYREADVFGVSLAEVDLWDDPIAEKRSSSKSKKSSSTKKGGSSSSQLQKKQHKRYKDRRKTTSIDSYLETPNRKSGDESCSTSTFDKPQSKKKNDLSKRKKKNKEKSASSSTRERNESSKKSSGKRTTRSSASSTTSTTTATTKSSSSSRTRSDDPTKGLPDRRSHSRRQCEQSMHTISSSSTNDTWLSERRSRRLETDDAKEMPFPHGEQHGTFDDKCHIRGRHRPETSYFRQNLSNDTPQSKSLYPDLGKGFAKSPPFRSPNHFQVKSKLAPDAIPRSFKSPDRSSKSYLPLHKNRGYQQMKENRRSSVRNSLQVFLGDQGAAGDEDKEEDWFLSEDFFGKTSHRSIRGSVVSDPLPADIQSPTHSLPANTPAQRRRNAANAKQAYLKKLDTSPSGRLDSFFRRAQNNVSHHMLNDERDPDEPVTIVSAPPLFSFKRGGNW